ncbi:MAG TPA: ABC transporter ATP-binding protein [Thioploca sp.]|nr:ABC transporter ATP-binding protein [Thioploca sp.]
MMAITANNLSFSFGGNNIISNADFSLEAGKIILLKGDNGCGKTTLLNLFSGLLKPQSGELRINLKGNSFDAYRYSDAQLAREGVGRLLQNIQLFPTMDVLDNVKMGGIVHLPGSNVLSALFYRKKIKQKEMESTSMAIKNLENVGMAHKKDSSADKLSVGQMKRVGIARLLQSDSTIWLLDEPLAGLDSHSITQILDLITEINDKQKKTIIIVEHLHNHIEAIADQSWQLVDAQLFLEKDG